MTFKVGADKTFAGDLDTMTQMLTAHLPFAFSKYADGEWAILTGRPIDTRADGNGGFRYDPQKPTDRRLGAELLRSFQHVDSKYFVGIGCPCCMGPAAFARMRELSGQRADHLTWANLWVNANYSTYCQRVIPVFAEYRVSLVCNHKAELDNLPFPVSDVLRVGTNAWINDHARIEEFVRGCGQTTAGLFLFCAGPLGNLLAWAGVVTNPENTYLDIGSTLDPWLFGSSGYTRRYLRGEQTARKVCVWSSPASRTKPAGTP